MRRIVITTMAALCLSGAALAKDPQKKKMSTTAAPYIGPAQALTTTPDEYVQGCRADIEAARASVARLKAMKTPRDPITAMQAFDDAGMRINDALSRSGLAREVHPDPKMRAAGEQCEQEASAVQTEFSLDRGIYDALAGLDISKFDAATKHYHTTSLRDFRRAGVDRDDATRARITALRDELVKIGQEFSKNIAEDVRRMPLEAAEMDGLPEDFKKSLKTEDGKPYVTTVSTQYVPYMTYATNEAAREKLWRIYRQRAYPKNLDVLNRLIGKRAELAHTLGYATWADYVTEDKMIGSKQNVADFIAKISKASEASAHRDYAELLAYKKTLHPDAKAVYWWDSSYLQDKLKATRYGVDSQQVRQYFEYPKVKQGVLDISSRIFGIQFKEVKDAPKWHADVDAYDVWEKDKLLGRIYLDMYPRDDKYKHFAMFPMNAGKSGSQLPEAALVCNFPRKTADDPGLMDHDQVETFFHEFGHLLHGVFSGHGRWAGGSLEWDFIEAPSQMLEEWIWEPAVLKTFATHYKSGEPIPAELVKKMKSAEELGKGLQVRTQMLYASTSLNYYNREPNFDTTRLLAELQDQYLPYKYEPNTYFQTSFGHLDGYSAIYYTYMWSLVIAKDMASVFKKEGFLNPAPAMRYRKAVLEPGASKPAGELVKDFLGRPYGFQAYEDWLNNKW